MRAPGHSRSRASFILSGWRLELLAAAAAAATYALFGTLLRGFAVVSAARLVLRRGARGVPSALALVALPSLFGCLFAAELLATARSLAACRGGLAATRRAVRAVAALSNSDASIGALPARALGRAAWACPPPPRRRRSSRSSSSSHGEAPGAAALALAAAAAAAARRWLLVAAAAAAVAPFTWSPSAAGRVAMAAWLLCPLKKRPAW
jgi:hypothetical protein